MVDHLWADRVVPKPNDRAMEAVERAFNASVRDLTQFIEQAFEPVLKLVARRLETKGHLYRRKSGAG